MSPEQIEEFLSSQVAAVEEFLNTHIASPNISEIANRVWADITRFGHPSISRTPELALAVPPTPPVVHVVEKGEWYKPVGVAVVVAAGLFLAYKLATRRSTATNERRQVVVVLGADSPPGLPLCLELEASGYIVIASVATPEAIPTIESRTNGYVRVLVLDPAQASSAVPFMRSLHASLALRYPLTAAGDPYNSSNELATHPYVHSVISLLALAPPPPPAPLEALSLSQAFIPRLQATHLTPLLVIQNLLPLLRVSAKRFNASASIVVLLPATATAHLAFDSTQAMIAAATSGAVDVLRRELAVSNQNRNLRVVVVEVGSFVTRSVAGIPSITYPPKLHLADLEEVWTPAMQATYGTAYGLLSDRAEEPVRRPVDAKIIVNALVGTVSRGRKGSRNGWAAVAFGIVSDWWRGERYAIGAGARTYSLVSRLPPRVLDAILYIPYALERLRERLMPTPPVVEIPPPPVPKAILPKPEEHDSESAPESYAASETDSHDGEKGWVSLKDSVVPIV